MTITVSGRPVAELGPVRSRQWVDAADLHEPWSLPSDETLARDIAALGAGLRDPRAQ